MLVHVLLCVGVSVLLCVLAHHKRDDSSAVSPAVLLLIIMQHCYNDDCLFSLSGVTDSLKAERVS